jgi:hypothetical protein
MLGTGKPLHLLTVGLIALMLTLTLGDGSKADAFFGSKDNKAGSSKSSTEMTEAGFRVVGAEANDPAVKSITERVDELVTASNNHDLRGILSHYSPKFVSGDNLTLD